MVFLFNAFSLAFLGVIVVGIHATGSFNFRKFLNSDDPEAKDFSNLADKFKLKFSGANEVNRRLSNFRNIKNRLNSFQSKFKNAKLGMNKFSLMSEEEQKQYFGAIVPPKTTETPTRSKRSALNDIVDTTHPTSFDFRTYGKVSPVKDQGACGSCWAFTTVAAVESQYLLRQNQSLDLSEQYLVNCHTTAAYQCLGGNVAYAIDYVKTSGIPAETCQPYTAAAGTCNSNCNPKYRVAGLKNFGTDESKYALQLYNYGPVAISFYIPAGFTFYESGILDMPAAQCQTTNVGMHGVIIVGYTPEYWIAKNSWGSDWGEDGYFRFKRGQNFCGMTMEAVVPFLNVTSSTTASPTTTTTSTTTTKAPTTNCPVANGMNSDARNSIRCVQKLQKVYGEVLFLTTSWCNLPEI